MIDPESDEEAPPPLTKKQEHLFTVYSDTAKVHAKQEQRQQCIEYTTLVSLFSSIDLLIICI